MLDDPAPVHDGDVVGHQRRLGVVVGHHDGGSACGVDDLGDLDSESFTKLPIEGRKGFVEQQQARTRGKSAGQCHPLLLPTRQLGDLPVPVPGEINQVQHFRHPGGGGILTPTSGTQSVSDVVCDAASGQQLSVLEHHPEVAPMSRDRRQIRSVERDRAAGQRFQAGDGADESGFATSRRTQQCRDGRSLGADRQAEVVEDGFGPITDCHRG